MTAHEFIAKWRTNELKERSASQSHFNDLCALLGLADPNTADGKGEWFTFEKGVEKTTGGDGWADVWRRDCFAWEYKGRHANLDKALQQLLRYARNLDNPPLLIVSDMDRIRVHTNFTNSVAEMHEFALEDLRDGAVRERLKQAFIDPDAFKPAKTRQTLTEEVAREFATLAQRLRDRGHDAQDVAHFVVRCAFCMFAEDVGLLPNNMFTRLVEESRRNPEDFAELASDLFRLMSKGGRLGLERVAWFNGGLFDNDAALPLNRVDVDLLFEACKQHWAEIDPSILGTLFERGLDPDKRSQLGAHYTDRAKIELIVGPTIAQPLTAEWAALRDHATAAVETAEAAAAAVRDRAAGHSELKAEVRALSLVIERNNQIEMFPDLTKTKLVRGLDDLRGELRAASAAVRAARDGVKTARDVFMAKLRDFRVLDPACGSGNFLYVALKLLKDIEHQVNTDAEALGVPLVAPEVGPANVLGIELNPFAAELARTSVWIGDIQWMRKNGFEPSRDPILKPLETIECRDAIINADGSASFWPTADVIIGNPPFLGAKLMKRGVGVAETEAIRDLYRGRLPGFTDLVCYWFENARTQIELGEAERAGLIATNSIRKNTNLPVLRRISETTRIFEAWSEEKWVVEGAAVDVSIVLFGNGGGLTRLNGMTVDHINADLTTGLDLTGTIVLRENRDGAFLGIQKSGPFDVSGEIARAWLREPINPNGRRNSEILKPYWNGDDVTGRPRDVWLIDLPVGLSEADASVFAGPFEHIQTTPDEGGKLVKQLRGELGERAGPRWWEQHWPRPEMRSRISPLQRYLVTPETAQHHLFVWQSLPVLPDKNLIVIPRDDETSFGILQSRFHSVWALRKGSDLQDRPRYTHTSVFATFPFPEGLTPDIPAADYADDPRAQAIAAAAARLNELRENWLNPDDLVVREPEVAPGYPDRILPRDEEAAKELKKRTLTNLYNARPHWLANAHAALDQAVADAYGWGEDWRADALTDDEILARLFRLNQDRAAAQAG